jgi:hypothetical protein
MTMKIEAIVTRRDKGLDAEIIVNSDIIGARYCQNDLECMIYFKLYGIMPDKIRWYRRHKDSPGAYQGPDDGLKRRKEDRGTI